MSDNTNIPMTEEEKSEERKYMEHRLEEHYLCLIIGWKRYPLGYIYTKQFNLMMKSIPAFQNLSIEDFKKYYSYYLRKECNDGSFFNYLINIDENKNTYMTKDFAIEYYSNDAANYFDNLRKNMKINLENERIRKLKHEALNNKLEKIREEESGTGLMNWIKNLFGIKGKVK